MFIKPNLKLFLQYFVQRSPESADEDYSSQEKLFDSSRCFYITYLCTYKKITFGTKTHFEQYCPLCRYLPLAEQYKVLKSLAKRFKSMQLKVEASVITKSTFQEVGNTKIKGKNFTNIIYSASIGDNKGDLSFTNFLFLF